MHSVVNPVIVMISRSREGAWIEIALKEKAFYRLFVAPARERGLKYAVHKN